MKKLLSYITILFCILFNSTFAEEIKEETVIIENNEPLVSVIMPVYNAENFLDKSVSSVINQTYKNLEILLIDDCSTDNSYNILKEYANKDNRIKLFHNEQNKHVSATRNVGIKNATGKYLYFIDSDDFIDNDYIEHLVKTAEKENADIVVNTNIYDFHKNQKTLSFFSREFNRRIFDDKKVLAIKIFPSVWNRLFKRELQTKYNILFPTDIKIGEDASFNILFFSKSNNIAFISPNSFYYYNKNNKNSIATTVNYNLYFNNTLLIIININKYLKENNLLNKVANFNFIDFKTMLFSNLFNNKIYINEKRKNYQELRNFILSIKDDIFKHKNMYLENEIDFINNIIKYQTYDELKSYYTKVHITLLLLIIFTSLILLIFIILILYIFHQVYKDFKKGINPFKVRKNNRKDS